MLFGSRVRSPSLTPFLGEMARVRVIMGALFMNRSDALLLDVPPITEGSQPCRPKVEFTHFCAPAGRGHVAWGGATRNPRYRDGRYVRSVGAVAARAQVNPPMYRYLRPAGAVFYMYTATWGSAWLALARHASPQAICSCSSGASLCWAWSRMSGLKRGCRPVVGTRILQKLVKKGMFNGER